MGQNKTKGPNKTTKSNSGAREHSGAVWIRRFSAQKRKNGREWRQTLCVFTGFRSIYYIIKT
jgi:hypothetical protein